MAIFNLKSSDSLQGVQWQRRGPWFVLRQVSMLKAGQPPTPLDGEVVIHCDQIDFVQVLP